MSIEIDADEVLKMAEQIETDASAFYERLGSIVKDAGSRQALFELAVMETDHKHVFTGLRERYAPGSSTEGPVAPGEVPEEWPGFVEYVNSGIREHLSARFTGRETRQEVMQRAIAFEKDTIVFFASMKKVLTGAAEKAEIDQVIAEEVGHILSLTTQLSLPP